MKRVPRYRSGADRARWLAELSDALGEAQRLLVRMGTNPVDDPLTMELYLRIKSARFSVKALQASSADGLPASTSPKWTKSSPWRRFD